MTIKISEEVIDLVNNDTSFQENGEEKTDVQDILLIEDVSLPTLPTNRIHNKKILIHNYTITTMSMLQDYIDCSERLKHLSMSGLHKIMRKSSNIKYQVKKDFNKDQNNNWNKEKWEKKENNPSNQNPVKESSSQESSMGKYVREEDTCRKDGKCEREENRRNENTKR